MKDLENRLKEKIFLKKDCEKKLIKIIKNKKLIN